MAKKSGDVKIRKTGKAEKAGGGTTQLPARGWLRYPLQSLHDEIDRLFEDFWPSLPMPRFGRRIFDIDPFRGMEQALAPMRLTSPSVDVGENDKEITIAAELPGMDEEDIEVVLSDDLLTIKGDKKEEKEEKKKDYYLMERRYGSFQRSFRVPDTVDRDKIDASFKKGVLTIRMPKVAKAKAAQRKIKIK